MLPKHAQLIYQPAQEDCTIGDWGIDISASEIRGWMPDGNLSSSFTCILKLATPQKTELHSQHMYTYLQ